jgi:hypothetical protein
MNFVTIRSDRTDKFTMHSINCQVAIKHYGFKMIARLAKDAPTTIEGELANMVQYANECGWNECPKIKICKCCKG